MRSEDVFVAHGVLELGELEINFTYWRCRACGVLGLCSCTMSVRFF